VHELGLDGAGQGVSVSSARALATSGHRRGSTALLVRDVAFIVDRRARLLMLIVFAFGLTDFSQLPHMKTSLPETIDPKVIVFCDFCSLWLLFTPTFSAGRQRTSAVRAKDREGPQWLCLQQADGFGEQGLFGSSCWPSCCEMHLTRCGSIGKGVGASLWALKCRCSPFYHRSVYRLTRFSSIHP
jgi:hypothetical protein